MKKSLRITHLGSVLIINHPLVQRVPPVLDEKSLRILLTLTVPETTLSFGERNEMIAAQVDFKIFAHLAADLRLGTPRAAVFFVSNSVNREE